MINDYILVTLHRPETVDIPNNLQSVFKALVFLNEELGWKVFFYMHPRTKDKLTKFGLKVPEKIIVEKPKDWLGFVSLLRAVRLVITDSGGVQEEAAILKIPCVTVRDTTERPETVIAKLNMLVGYRTFSIVQGTKDILNIFGKKQYDPKPLYGDGHAGEKIVNILKEEL